jgi:anti-sigma regulatory factor (Ser/Thr protein kinase)
MDFRTLILSALKSRGQVKVADIVKKTGFSRVYVQRQFRQLVDEGRLTLVGKANTAHYVLLKGDTKEKIRKKQLRVHRILLNRDLHEDRVLRGIKDESGIFIDLRQNVTAILEYAFTEMLNNAIEHSGSEKIEIVIVRTPTDVRFEVVDRGVGIFNNIMAKKRLGNEMEAIQSLLKGKETTAPEAHSGEGIFFTSKVADSLVFRSSHKKLVYDNLAEDIYIKDLKDVYGTKVFFLIRVDTRKTLRAAFARYTDDSYEFSRTGVHVKLYQKGIEYVSRSQARRILAGMEKFKTIELDFSEVGTAGQAFADEIFRVWHSRYPKITIVPVNANDNVMFMIKRAQS